MSDRIIEVDLDGKLYECPLYASNDSEGGIMCNLVLVRCDSEKPAPKNCPLRKGPVVVKAKEK